MASIHSGQQALLSSPETCDTGSKQTTSGYALPSSLQAERKSLKSSAAEGMEVFKVSKGGKLQQRRLAFSPDHRSIFVTTNKIKSFKGLLKYALPQTREVTAKGIGISTIDRIQKGQLTKRFLVAKEEALDNGKDLLGDESTSLSIIYRVCSSDNSMFLEQLSQKPTFNNGSRNNRYESLDLIVPSPKDYGNLVAALEDLLSIYRNERMTYDRNILLLHHHWIDMGKDLNESMSVTEWVELCERLNVPLKKQQLQSLYREMVKDLELDEERLSMWMIAELICDVKFFSMEALGLRFVNQDPFLRLWQEVAGTDPVPALKVTNSSDTVDSLELQVNRSEEEKTISSVALLSFIRSQQKEYKTSHEDTLTLLHAINDQTSSRELAGDESHDEEALSTKDRLTKSRFFSFLLSDANDILDPAKGAIGADDMTQPMSHYWINTSHDTYLDRSRNRKDDVAAVDEQLYIAALNRGVRCLELDVWDSLDGQPVVMFSKPETGEEPFIPFAFILRVVRNFLLANPKSYPVILNIENHCSFGVQEIMASQLTEFIHSTGIMANSKVGGYTFDEMDLLPSPEKLRGKVVIMGKRPRVIKDGARVVNDDFDDENDQYHDDALPNAKSIEENEEEEEGIVIGFDAAGPIRSLDPHMTHNVVRHTPGELLYMAQQDAEHAKIQAANAELKALSMKDQAVSAENHAEGLMHKAGLSKRDISHLIGRDKTIEIDPSGQVELLNRADGEGVEVQDFLNDAVEGARTTYTEADAVAIEASDLATYSLQKLNSITETLQEAELELQVALKHERTVEEASQRAAADARNKREHADTARRRVETVKGLLRDCEDNAASAETVVVTAMTESKISEKRALETEARAARAQSNAKKDRARADDETRREEELEREAALLHDELTAAFEAAKENRERHHKAASMLDRVNDQIRLIESSSQYIKERREMPDHVREEKESRTPRHGGKALDKHAAKMEERQMCIELIKEAEREAEEAEDRCQRAKEAFEDKAHRWKKQADVASRARKQADRSSHNAEEMAEHAEEEREAANLRHIARKKAQSSVTEKDSYRTSVEAQLVEAERAAAEASALAIEARNEAERLSQQVDRLPSHKELLMTVEYWRKERNKANEDYEKKKAIKIDAEKKAAEAKRLFDTSTEVFSSAMKDAAEEHTKANVQRLLDRNAIIAYNQARLARKQSDHALELARLAQSVVAEKLSAITRAKEYKEKMERITIIPVSLARMTLIHTTKHRYWEKSISLPGTFLHGFSQPVLAEMCERDPQHPRKLKEFTVNHLCRTFPSKKFSANNDSNNVNCDPVFQWALGCQMVAMNFGMLDENILICDGRFRKNGSCGYVLKPDYLRMDEAQEREQKWNINILCGSCLPKPDLSFNKKAMSVGSGPVYINPFVKIVVYDGSGLTTRRLEHTTAVIKKNGLNPVWDDKKGFRFAVGCPSLSIIVFSVWDKNESGGEEFIGASAIPVCCMREGFRSVALFDSNHTRGGPYAFASLFIRTQKVAV